MDRAKQRFQFLERVAALKGRKFGVLASNCFLAGATYADANPDWTPINEDLPEDESLTLVYDKYGNYHCARYSAQSGEWISNTMDHTAIMGVEYWMFVPQPPHTGAKPNF
jgi:hypothetical protein